MNSLVKLGSFLGALSFAAIVAIGYHQKTEVDYINSHQPPTITQIQNDVVAFETDSGSVCSGWVDSRTGKINTAAHCFEFAAGEHEAIVHFNDGTTEIWKTDYVTTTDDPKSDFATLVPRDKDSKHRNGLKVCTFKPYYGEKIVVMGAPLGVEKSMSFGWVGNPEVSGLIEVDVKILPGNSGGPVIDIETGCVLGQAEMIYTANYAEDYGVNFATPVK